MKNAFQTLKAQDQGFCQSLFCLPQEDEDAVQFANRVKAAIARQGGLVDLLW